MYILKLVDQQYFLRRLVPLEILDNGWTQVFKDPANSLEWILFHHHSEKQGGGYPVLRVNPLPEQLPIWLMQCFSSSNEDDIIGIAWELSTQFERWPQILDWLEANSAMLTKTQITLFINNLEILQPTNRRIIVGKSVSEIDDDFRFFLLLAQRARKLIGE